MVLAALLVPLLAGLAGYLPGPREAGIETVRNETAHEMGRGLLRDARVGHVRPVRRWAARPGRTIALRTTDRERNAAGTTFAVGPSGFEQAVCQCDHHRSGWPLSPTRDLGPAIAVTMLLLLATAALVLAAWLRGPRGSTTPDGAYRMVTRIASRLGFGPGSAQTVYEYAATLGDVLPEARPELETGARAKVESAYARATLDAARDEDLRAAQHRMRVALLRLVLGRREGRRRH